MIPGTLKIVPREISDMGPKEQVFEGFFKDHPQSGQDFKFYFNSKPPGAKEEQGFSMTFKVLTVLTQAGKMTLYAEAAVCTLIIGHESRKKPAIIARA